LSRTMLICVVCPRGCRINIDEDEGKIKEISGYSCEKGKKYAKREYYNPIRILPTTVIIKNGELPLLPVKTEKAIPKKYLLPAMNVIANTIVEAPIKIGETIIKNILDTGVDIVATRNIELKT